MTIDAGDAIPRLGASWPTPRFVGSGQRRGPDHSELVFTYMTAEQMKARVISLTGFEHPAFDQYAAILGHVDPVTTQRTTDRPTLLSVLLLHRIATELAALVVEREQFLWPVERSVFNDVDLSKVASAAEVAAFISGLFNTWLTQPLLGIAKSELLKAYQEAASVAAVPTAGYQAVLALMLQHAGLFYT